MSNGGKTGVSVFSILSSRQEQIIVAGSHFTGSFEAGLHTLPQPNRRRNCPIPAKTGLEWAIRPIDSPWYKGVVPFYRFEFEANVPPEIVFERIKSLVREKPTFWESFSRTWRDPDPASPPFIGSVLGDSFKLQRDIRYRNSFLPMIRGHFVATPLGTRVFVTMFIHPLSALFMLFWLGMVGYFALTNTSEKTLIPWGMFYFGIVMAVGGFLYEAVKARDMISSAVLQTHN